MNSLIVLAAAVITAMFAWFFLEHYTWPVLISAWIGIFIGWFSRDLVIADQQERREEGRPSEAGDH